MSWQDETPPSAANTDYSLHISGHLLAADVPSRLPRKPRGRLPHCKMCGHLLSSRFEGVCEVLLEPLETGARCGCTGV